MTREIIWGKLKKVLSDGQYTETIREVSLDTKINTTFNSITFIKLIVAVETEFDIEFDDEDLSVDNIDELNDVVDRICDYIARK